MKTSWLGAWKAYRSNHYAVDSEPLTPEEPLRQTLLGIEQLGALALQMGHSHVIVPERRSDWLLRRLRENEEVITHTHTLIAEAVTRRHAISPASEWLVDNFYVVQEQIHLIRMHFPPGFCRQLPYLNTDPPVPRIYDVVLTLISHLDGRIDSEALERFIYSYQQAAPLSLGELWATPIMLRLALVENLRRVSTLISNARAQRNLANHWADRLIDAAQTDPDRIITILSSMVESQPPMESAFVSELVRRLHGQHAALRVVLEWVSQNLMRKSETAERLILSESQRQAADQISIGNCFSSFRFLDATDWGKFVERHSIVELILQQDPAGVYGQSDFQTRDRCRHVVERVARRAGMPERRPAEKAVEMAQAAVKKHGRNAVSAHVGFYLIDDGYRQLLKALHVRRSLSEIFRHTLRCGALVFYLLAVTGLTLLLTALTFPLLPPWLPPWLELLVLLLFAMVAGQFAVSIVNYFCTRLVPPRLLARLDCSDGLTEAHATLVVVPCILHDGEEVADLLESLEVKYLANRDPNIYFGILSDFPDSNEQVLPEDDSLLRPMVEGIDALNEHYGNQGRKPFCLFHRPRLWNPSEGLWMGRERKRGKLEDIVCLICDGDEKNFLKITADRDYLKNIQYLITLDADTQLPGETAAELVGTMAHALNAPVFDAGRRRVMRGYTILQPRVASSLLSSRRSLFARLFAGEPGLDPYTRAVSDVYQDLFGEGSFIGKGIINVASFYHLLAGRLPENIILSHDLLEGSLTRCGLVSDVLLFEDHPATLAADFGRRHRWVRGDWQLLPWIFNMQPCGALGELPARLRLLGRWKLVDNLRRSLVAPIAVLLFALAWLFAINNIEATGLLVGLLTLPTVLTGLWALPLKPRDIPLRLHLEDATTALATSLAQSCLGLVLLPLEAYANIDAIFRSLFRLLISGRRRLQWQASSHANRLSSHGPTQILAFVLPELLVAAALLALVPWLHPEAFLTAAPLIMVWLLSPLLVWFLSRPIVEPVVVLDDRSNLFLQLLARKTYRYFEEYVNRENNFLPPDNVQEVPMLMVASRTSPTNIGLALLANVTAWDFGWITQKVLLERSELTLRTMGQLKRFRGHFLNWYDTRTLSPLMPQYVSTVDSGNLAGDLLVLRSGLVEMLRMPIASPRAARGYKDTLLVLCDHVAALIAGSGADVAAYAMAFQPVIKDLLVTADLRPAEPRALRSWLSRTETIFETARRHTTKNPPGSEAVVWFFNAARQQIRAESDELSQLMPWLACDIPPITHATESDEVRLLYQTVHRIVAELSLSLPIMRFKEIADEAAELLHGVVQEARGEAVKKWAAALAQQLAASSELIMSRCELMTRLSRQCTEFAEMDFRFLYAPSRKLMTIGFNVDQNRADDGFYDLLASEARLASYIAIVSGQIPREHWFALGRQLTSIGGQATLLSWSGSMFEYLMPMIVMPDFPRTLLHQSMRAVVVRNMVYGRDRGIPWGVSESGYNLTDTQMHYQYKAFGVPGLGYRRRLSEDVVIAPYASMLALMVAPADATENLTRLADMGAMGDCGLFEAIDYTPERSAEPGRPEIVRSFMAHHQGMGLLSLAMFLLDKPMQRRFAADPLLRSGELLLQERIPRVEPLFPHSTEVAQARNPLATESNAWRTFNGPLTPEPEVHLLSNGRYQLLLTAGGASRATWKNLALTRWRTDRTRDNWGMFCYLMDLDSGRVWSMPFQPVQLSADGYEATFSEGKAEYRRRDGTLEQVMHVAVSPEDDIEVRRLSLTNRGKRIRHLEITTYLEVVLAPQVADLAHRAFENLFVNTDANINLRTVLAGRRPRRRKDTGPWAFHSVFVRGADNAPFSFQTERSAFIGRGRSVENPLALRHRGELPNSHGAVLDPIMSIRRTIALAPDQTIVIEMILGAAPSRQECEQLAQRYSDQRFTDRVMSLAWSHGQVLLRQLGASNGDAQLFGQLAGALVYPGSRFTGNAELIRSNRRGQSGLWAMGISGDLPIVLLRITNEENILLVRQVLQAHAFWRNKGLAVDLVIWNQDTSNYRQNLNDAILAVIASGSGSQWLDKPGGIFVRRADLIAESDRRLLISSAAISFVDTAGTFAQQCRPSLLKTQVASQIVPVLQPTKDLIPASSQRSDLNSFNGIGGFTRDGREYVMQMRPNILPPAPWSNVISGRRIGTVVTERGSMYTWVDNAHEYRLTPWFNDPVSDPTGEAFYIRDDQTGRFWSPMAGAAGVPTLAVARHGFGYSVFESSVQDIDCELTVFCHMNEPVKFALIKLTNRSNRSRSLSVTSYVQWVLAETAERTLPHIWTQMDVKSGAIFAHNAWNLDFGNWVAFAGTSEARRSVTGDRTEFIGRSGSTASPAAMRAVKLLGRLGPAMDPCAAIMCDIQLPSQGSKELVFVLGAGADQAQAQALVNRFQSVTAARSALEEVWWHWKKTLGRIYLQTPDAGFDALANGWLLYQTISSRIWGRSGFYQSGGAFGFRDQLQDAMAAALADPAILRSHLLLCASRQFEEGDVQHWWHPPSGRGVRTKFSDDFLWLPLALAHYVRLTGDTGILNENVGFLAGRPVGEHEESWYDQPQKSDKIATLYEHAILALRHGLRDGRHGLPLIGCGDWNDGMNLVGEAGEGESVWLAFFQCHVFEKMRDIARLKSDAPAVTLCEDRIGQLTRALHDQAWDGQWYLRAFFDDGTPLGSKDSTQCQIDSLPQSWATLAGVGEPERRKAALDAVESMLVDEHLQLIKLLDPPFNDPVKDPGYIAGYLPGVRENGGQYTHAAIWVVMAMAMAGRTALAWKLFDMINPIHHASSSAKMDTYRVEPYVVAADVYTLTNCPGRGGWTWYTGSAGWMYRLMIETFVGLRIEADRLWFDPRVPPQWAAFTVHYRYFETFYHIALERSEQPGVVVDNVPSPDGFIHLVNDRREHNVQIRYTVPELPPAAGVIPAK